MAQRMWACLIAAACCSATPALAQLPAIPAGSITVELADFVRMPDTRGTGTGENGLTASNYARISTMRDMGSGKLMINDLRGQVFTVDIRTGATTQYLDVDDYFDKFIIGTGLATGLTTIALHPDFYTNGKFYTVHEETAVGNPATPDFVAVGDPGNIAGGQQEVIVEWTATDPFAATFSGTHRELMRIAQPVGNLHNHGELAFNPNANPGDDDYGMLYIAGGESGYDADNKGSEQAQNLNSIFGKILRIDPTPGISSAYTIPDDNPFVDAPGLDEVFAYGFRNAHRIMWDTDGTMYTTDIGQHNIEEINLLHAGENYGWSSREGTFVYNDDDTFGDPAPSPATDSYTYPVAQYDHDEGDGIAGGFIYRGTRVPELVGKFVFGDIVNGRLFYADVADLLAADADDTLATAPIYELFITRDGVATTIMHLMANALGVNVNDVPYDRADLRFGQTADGEIFITTKGDGWVRVFAPGYVALTGDANNDGVVDAADYLAIEANLGAIGLADGFLFGDANNDGRVDGDDWLAVEQNYGESLPGPPIPEPATAALTLLGTAILRRRR